MSSKQNKNLSENLKEVNKILSDSEKNQFEATYLWRLSDAEIAEECTRYSYVYAANDPLMNKLAVLFEAASRILANEVVIKKKLQVKSLTDKRAKEASS